jgi:hypothetical protein
MIIMTGATVNNDSAIQAADDHEEIAIERLGRSSDSVVETGTYCTSITSTGRVKL